MLEYSETVMLEQGLEAIIRSTSDRDLQASVDFFRAFPDDEKQYFAVDLCCPGQVEKRYEQVKAGKAVRLVATCEGRIVGEAGLDSMRYGWLSRSGDVTLIALPQYRGKKLREALAREIFLLAARLGMHVLLARVLDSQSRTRQIFKSLGFRHEATQKGHAVDAGGREHDVHLMTFSLKKMWSQMEEAIEETSSSPREW